MPWEHEEIKIEDEVKKETFKKYLEFFIENRLKEQQQDKESIS